MGAVRKTEDFKDFDKKELYFIPLGGSEQFGVNLNVYGTQGKWLVADFGIGFADQRHPGVDILLPDPGFIAEKKKDIVGLIITHAHEDHIGAVPYLWPKLRCPVYCTEFTAAILRRKLQEAKGCEDLEIHVVKNLDTIKLGPFKVQFLPVAHSIPDTVGLVIETKQGRVVHSGDWNMDPTPVAGNLTEPEPFQKAGKKGVLAYVGDSTNAEKPGRAGSEGEVEPGLEALFGECKGLIAVTIFSSNIGRMKSVAKAARANGRQVMLVGRSLKRMADAAHECGYLDEIRDFVEEDQFDHISRNKLVLMCTGSQGEARAMLPRIARGDHRRIDLGKGDTVIFSSRSIPGNEREIIDVKNQLVEAGVRVISPRDTKHTIHVSGHACRDEIADMFSWVSPEVVVPVHGERSMIEAQAQLAKECQIRQAIIPNNGSVILLKEGGSQIVGEVDTGLLAVEPGRVISTNHSAIIQRRKLQYSGTVHITLVLDEAGDWASDIQMTTVGLTDLSEEEDLELEQDILQEVEDVVSDMTDEELQDDELVAEEVRIGVRRFIYHILRIKPKTTVHLVRVP